MNGNISTGTLGEQCAVSFLASQGFSLVAQNVRASFGELDIVCHDQQGVLVVIEVKTLSRIGSLAPEDNLTHAKFFKLSRMAQFYANSHPELVHEQQGWRIDLVTILLNPPPGVETYHYGDTQFAATHYKNISP